MPIAPPRTCRLAAAHSTSAIHYIDTTIGQSNQTCVSRNASHRCRAQKVKEEQKVFAVKKKPVDLVENRTCLLCFVFLPNYFGTVYSRRLVEIDWRKIEFTLTHKDNDYWFCCQLDFRLAAFKKWRFTLDNLQKGPSRADEDDTKRGAGPSRRRHHLAVRGRAVLHSMFAQ